MTVPKRFGVLRIWGWLLKILAWIVLIFSILSAIGAVAAPNSLSQLLGTATTNPMVAFLGSQAGGIILGVVSLLFGIIYCVVIFAAGEQVHMQLAIEENTRLTAALLLRMHQESQQETRPGYGAGFESERFER
jgi:predicted PurR-regulated permease PerM